MTIKQSESVVDLIELEGVWWIPELGENTPKCSGVLRYKVGEKRELKLWGDLDAFLDPQKHEFDVICGECPGNKFVTLFGCGVNSRNGFNRMGTPGIPIARIGFLEMWVGLQPYMRKEDVCFQEFTFGINNLEQWQNAKSFSFHFLDKGFERVDVSYVKPPVISLYEDDLVIISIVYELGPLVSSIGQKFFTIEHSARIQIKPKSGKLGFHGTNNSLKYYQNAIFQFFTLLLGGFTFTYDCKGVSFSSDLRKTVSEATYYQARSLSNEQTTTVCESDMFLPFHVLDDRVQKLFTRFLSQWDILQHYVPQFTAFQNHVFGWTFHTLPELIYTFEGFEKTLYNLPHKAKGKKVSLQERFDAVYVACIAKVFP